MTTEANNTTERNALNALAEYVALHIRKNEGIIKDYMEALAENFMESFEWKLKTIYKCNLKLEYLVEINKLLAEEDMEFYLRHTIEDKTDDIVHARSKFANCTATLAQR